MLNILAKFILTGTSFSPFFVAYAIKKLENGSSMFTVLTFLLIAIVLICICWLILTYITYRSEKFSGSCSNYTIERREHEGLVFLLVYLLPIIRTESDPLINEPITTIFCLVVVIIAISRSHAFHYNPVMRLFGYRFYTLKSREAPPFLLICKFDWPSNKELVMVTIAKDVILECGE